ncbi:MAG: gliding motility-associated C-terminal domain-containing protein, partial [Bacteroidales bacterium]|nr:gliding motility-associated C-terminal domain-containing protein [Bacteroidales bacterium]
NPPMESRSFRIQWTGDNGITTYSPVIDIKGEKPIAPDTTRISYVSVDDNNQINLKLTATDSPSSASALLLRRNKATGDEVTHPLPEYVMRNYLYIDQEASPDSSYAYVLIITDKCGHQISKSDSAYNVVASVAAEPNNSNLVSWNTLLLTSGIISTNTILRSVDNGEWEPIANVTERYNEYSDPLSNMIADANTYSGRFCYRVQIIRTNGDTIYSNIACLQREPVMYIPNALNPNSDIMDNRTFRPRADFLSDYHLAIYDKRGALLFQSDDLNVGWDGYDRQSKLCHRDTYVYHISYKTSSGKQVNKSGMVNLLY